MYVLRGNMERCFPRQHSTYNVKKLLLATHGATDIRACPQGEALPALHLPTAEEALGAV